MSLLALPPELLVAIFECIDDPATLLPAASSCKKLHTIYDVGKHLILPRVVCNAMGGDGAFTASLLALRIDAILPDYDDLNPADVALFRADVQALKDSASTPTTAECKKCFERVRICQDLEVLYSRFRKDSSTSNVSRLTRTESSKFCVALHRIWLASLYMDSVVHDLCMEPVTRVPLLYNDYSAQDVYDIHCVLEFLGEQVGESLPNQNTPRPRGALQLECLFCGPENLLEAFLKPEKAADYLFNGDWDRPSGHPWNDDLRLVFIRLGLLNATATTLTIPTAIRPIVDPAVHLDLQQCWGCHEQAGFRLWAGNNWDRPPCDLRLETILNFLPGYLKRNAYERPLLAHYLGIEDPLGVQLPSQAPRSTMNRLTSVPHMTVARILQSLCDLPQLVNTMKQTTYVQNCPFFDITNADPLCSVCIRDLVKNRLWILWLSVKVAAAPDEEKKQDCWFGYDCRMQADNPEHAYALNHACPDTWRERNEKQSRHDPSQG
ncbi:hypothetical protein EXIGLDRAFT_753018 [Exidia glandulosa HHB12029]|uniref:F-box domain-containing protein n=1 Tax=Exidia glandulosa HHB12029 TaxID=1314781 RepID=A0A165E3J4_EXIGL|nr:hypothetical protein EXIGLDRAFT_753018 [Exidia glandulosa HHB12029]